MITTRVLPDVLLDIRRPHRMVERSLMVYRRNWIHLATGFLEPLFYLLSIRVGLSTLVGDVEVGGNLIPYEAFVAPGLMAASAMNGAVFDATMNIFFKWKHAKLYDSVVATPLTPGDIAVGEISFAVMRGLLYSTAFLVTMAVLGLVESPWMVMSIPIAVLIGFTFSSIGMACTTFMRSWADFEYVPALTLPLFLFSATIYPASAYGRWSFLLDISPLYHGVTLIRHANAGSFGWSSLGHAMVLVVLTLVGITIASRRMKTLLLS